MKDIENLKANLLVAYTRKHDAKIAYDQADEQITTIRAVLAGVELEQKIAKEAAERQAEKDALWTKKAVKDDKPKES